MPTHGGIKLRLVSQMEFGVHPEFSHPESTQFTNRSPDLRLSPPSATAESKADQVLGRPSVISVYTPSVPGSRFWLNFSIDAEAAGRSPWYYFKLFMNGRNIASWGTNSKTDPKGQIMRGLFEPGPRWNYKVDNVVYKNMGIETRPFFFSNEDQSQSAAKDGGLIEVLVYRARGRKRKMPEPQNFKDQEPYGVVMPSSGLFDKPQDAKYYDWHLKDPKDRPFATFKFHYRSWDSLASLQLIPSGFPRRMMPASPSILSLNGLSREMQELLAESDSEKEADSPMKFSESSGSDTPWMTDVFDDVPDEAAKNKENREAFVIPPDTSPCFPVRKDSILNSKIARAKIEKPTSPTTNPSPWKGYLDRPLPDIPTRESSLKHSRKSSNLSNAPSIAPSLLPYIERDTLSPEPEIGVASLVAVTHRTSPINDDQVNARKVLSHLTLIPSDDDSSDLGTPSQNPVPPRTSSKSTKRHGMTPPLYNLPNITIRKTRRSPVKTPPKKPVGAYSPGAQNGSQPFIQVDNSTSLSLTESEWMCRTPSPVKHHPVLAAEPNHERTPPVTAKKAYAVENGSLRGKKGKKDKTADEKGSLRKKARGWYDKMKGSDESSTLSDTFNDSDGSKIKLTGNWI